MSKKQIIDTLKLLAKLLVTSFALWFVFSKIDIQQFKQKLWASNPYWLLLAALFFALSQYVNSYRLKSFFQAMKMNIDSKYNIKLYLLGLFYNVFLPGGIGGDGYKIYILKKKFNQPTKKIFWAVFLDRLSGLWAIGLLSVILAHQLHAKTNFYIFLDSAFVIGSVVYYFVYRHFYPDFFTALKTSHSLAIISQILITLSATSILIAMKLNTTFSPYLTIFLLSSLAAVVPISIGGLGVREAMFAYGAKQIILDIDIAISLSLLFYAVSVSVSLIGGYFVFRAHEFAPMPQEENV